MLSISEICHRAQTGKTMKAETFDLDVVYANAKRLSEQHNIVYDPKTPVPTDDDLADRVYQAGVDFVTEVGVYCPDTGRVIQFTRAEVLEAIAQAPGRCIMGEGKDRYVWTPRKPDSDLEPWYHVGAGIMVSDERILCNLTREYGRIKQANSISVSALETIEGQMVISGTPTEILAAISSMQIARQALAQAGRPGLAIGNCISTAGTAMATVAASGAQFGLRPSDGWLVGSRAEMKVAMESLNKAAFLRSWGANIGNEGAPLVGGYGGGPSGAAILNVGYVLIGRLVFNCDYHLTFPFHIGKNCTTVPEVLWAVAVSNQALSRNTRELIWSDPYMAAGPMTKQYYYECAAYVATAISSGVSIQTCHPARAVLLDHITPMEMLGSVELTEACVGMKRSEANELVKELLSKYEDKIDDAPAGKRYQDCYDMDTGQPSAEYVDLYGEVKEELRQMGFGYRL